MATTNEEALAHALRELPGWQRHGDSIRRTYQFDDFASATLFVSRVADATAAAGHQPDIAIRGGRVTLELTPGTGTTLTADDLAVASRIQRLVGDHHHPVGRATPWSPTGRLAGIRERPVGPAGPWSVSDGSLPPCPGTVPGPVSGLASRWRRTAIEPSGTR